MQVTKNYTIVVTDDKGDPIEEGDAIMFLYDGRTRIAIFNGFDKRSRVMLTDYMSGEPYTCMLASVTESRKLKDANP